MPHFTLSELNSNNNKSVPMKRPFEYNGQNFKRLSNIKIAILV